VKNPDDVNNENKKDFPYRLRWTGSAVLDIPLTQLSSGLEDLNF
jgi:hypothetical protein